MEGQNYYVYILINPQGCIYIGQTDNLQRRLCEHNSVEHNINKYTSKNPGPWNLIYSQDHPTRSAAMVREKWLKGTSGRRWIKKNLLERVRHTEGVPD